MASESGSTAAATGGGPRGLPAVAALCGGFFPIARTVSRRDFRPARTGTLARCSAPTLPLLQGGLDATGRLAALSKMRGLSGPT